MKKILRTFSLCLSLLVLTSCSVSPGSAANQPLQSVDTAMGTVIQQNIYCKDTDKETTNKNITDDILSEITNLEGQLLSRRLESAEIYKINEAADSSVEMQADTGDSSSTEIRTIEISDELAAILADCEQVEKTSDGAFDLTIGDVVELWDIDDYAGQENTEGFQLPTGEAITEALSHTGYEKVKLQGNLLQLPVNMKLDLGAVGKGIALDDIRQYLEQKTSVQGAVISVGGSILTYGMKPDASTWKVAIVNPRDTTSNIGYLELTGDWCISTSGDYERFVEVDGVRYHHILNPETGYPADSGLSGVTVLSKNGLLSDALSTACFVLGEEKARNLAAAYEAEILFVDKEGKITMTDGMESYYRAAK